MSSLGKNDSPFLRMKVTAAESYIAPSPWRLMRRRVFGHAGLVVGGAVFLLIVVMAIFAPLIAPYDPYSQSLTNRLVPPIWHENGTWTHPLGTDRLGRDYLSRLIYGSRISLAIGLATAVISGLIGSVLGICAGYFGGRVDMVISYIITVRLALPAVLVALAVVAITGSSLHLVIIVLGLLLWDQFAVVTRSATMQVRSQDFVTAAEALGCSKFRLIFSEVLPNVMNPLIVVLTLEMAHAILLEAALSFLGFGVQPPLPSWGLMILEAKPYMFFSGWMILLPGGALFLLVLAIYLMGDGLRDVTAPENRN